MSSSDPPDINITICNKIQLQTSPLLADVCLCPLVKRSRSGSPSEEQRVAENRRRSGSGSSSCWEIIDH